MAAVFDLGKAVQAANEAHPVTGGDARMAEVRATAWLRYRAAHSAAQHARAELSRHIRVNYQTARTEQQAMVENGKTMQRVEAFATIARTLWDAAAFLCDMHDWDDDGKAAGVVWEITFESIPA